MRSYWPGWHIYHLGLGCIIQKLLFEDLPLVCGRHRCVPRCAHQKISKEPPFHPLDGLSQGAVSCAASTGEPETQQAAHDVQLSSAAC